MNTIVEHVTFVALLDGDPPKLLFRKDLRQTEGQGRIFTEAVPLPDSMMQRRIAVELQAEDEIELSVAYDYSSPGWPSCVIGYHKAVKVVEELATAPPRHDLAGA